jgi:hypothetical protein
MKWTVVEFVKLCFFNYPYVMWYEVKKKNTILYISYIKRSAKNDIFPLKVICDFKSKCTLLWNCMLGENCS